jgi:hypothetical protein
MLKLGQLVRSSEDRAVQQLKTVAVVRMGRLLTIKFQRKINADS